jgi:hypothetical protein
LETGADEYVTKRSKAQHACARRRSVSSGLTMASSCTARRGTILRPRSLTTSAGLTPSRRTGR